MGKRNRHVKYLTTKQTKVRVITIPGQPDRIEIEAKKDAFLQMKCLDLPDPSPKEKELRKLAEIWMRPDKEAIAQLMKMWKPVT